MPFAKSQDGLNLHYAVHDYTDPWKSAPVLILQHGYGRSSRFWYNLIPNLSRFYKVVCPDMRGLGQSSKDFDLGSGISVDNFVSDVISIADAVGADTFHYAGESMGGIIGFATAARHPQRVRTLSLMSAPLKINQASQELFKFGFASRDEAMRSMGSKGWSEAMNTASRFPPGADPGMMRWYAEEMGKSDVEVLIAMARFNSTVDVSSLLHGIKAPTLGLYPSDGKTASTDQQRILLDTVPGSRIVHIPSPYHMVWVMAPAACARHILYFMAANDGTVCDEK